jgi:hypothetical protein
MHAKPDGEADTSQSIMERTGARDGATRPFGLVQIDAALADRLPAQPASLPPSRRGAPPRWLISIA